MYVINVSFPSMCSLLYKLTPCFLRKDLWSDKIAECSTPQRVSFRGDPRAHQYIQTSRKSYNRKINLNVFIPEVPKLTLDETSFEKH